MSFNNTNTAHDVNSSTSSDDQSSVNSVIHVTTVDDNGGFSSPRSAHLEPDSRSDQAKSENVQIQNIPQQFDILVPDDSLDSDDSILLRKLQDSDTSSEDTEM